MKCRSRGCNLPKRSLQFVPLKINKRPREKCCMTACKSVEEQSQSSAAPPPPRLFNFPKIDSLLQKWCDNTQQNAEKARYLKICEKHFELNTIGKYRPRPLALPTLLLDNNGNRQPIHENPKQLGKYRSEKMESGKVRKYVRRNCCAIISCMKSKNDGVRLYNYPRESLLLRWWAANCRHHRYQAARYNFLICSDHFEEDCFGINQRLRRGSIPTLNLGYDDPKKIAKLHKSNFEKFKKLKRMKSSAMPSSSPSAAAAMPLHCCVPNCGRTKQDDGVNLYRFPDKSEILANWCKNLHLELDRVECKKLLICNMHFEARCISQRGIFKRAVPTLLLGHSNIEGGVDLIENPESFQRPDNYLQCCVPHCGSSKIEKGVILHSFPKIRSLFEKWAHNLNLPLSNDLWHKNKVCNKHFEVYCYVYKRLKAGSLPTLNLGHDNISNIFTINEDELNNTRKPKRKNGSNVNVNDTTEPPLPTCSYPINRDLSAIDRVSETDASNQDSSFWMDIEDGASMDAFLQSCFGENTGSDEELSDIQDIKKPRIKAPYKDEPDIKLGLDYNRNRNSEQRDRSSKSSLVCHVPDCTTTLHTLPVEADLYAKWTNNCQLDANSERRRHFRVCNRHFERKLYGNNFQLINGAMPTLELGSNPPSTIYDNRELPCNQEKEKEKLLPTAKCWLSHCHKSVNGDGVKLFKFPESKAEIEKWEHNLSMQYDRNALICSEHFTMSAFVLSTEDGKILRLKMLAVPILNLGANSPSWLYAEISKHKDEIQIHEECNVSGCPNTNRNARIFSDFPSDFQLFTKWCFNLQIDPRKYCEGEFNVCSAHFHSYFLTKDGLDKMAVPTLNLGSVEEFYAPQRKKPPPPLPVHKCCVQNCTEKRNQFLFDFPRNPSLRRQWAYNIKVDESSSQDLKVCRKHFHKNCLRNNRLHPEAVPTLCLGYEVVPLYPNRGSYGNASTTLAYNNEIDTMQQTNNHGNDDDDDDVILLEEENDDDDDYDMS